ncbi:LuxR C-terminal-related transcriptional regulator [Namhaeicola litoreus]|uniref:LuxR C-terminal-related transcriptional regulator n=1 Tax=Namhaeicola litoreus TaxID=1052145 RepID=A0ABW3Y292_9FLAO
MLNTKLNRQVITKDLLKRKRLLEKLEKHSHLPFILLSAPAGYGKSIVVSQWLEHCQNNYAWLSIDKSMNDSATFISYFIEMLKRSESVEIEKLKELEKELHFLSWEGIINSIINIVNEFQKQTSLIFDDYYLIHNPDIHQLVETLLRENLVNLQIIIITRWDPPFQFKELRLYQKMIEFRMRTLKFDEDEIAQLIALEQRVEFSEEKIKELSTKTEGWILVIRMILLASDFSVLKDENSGSKFLINDLDRIMSLISVGLDSGFFRQMQLIAHCDQFNAELINFICSFAFPDSCEGDVFLSKLKELNFFLIQTTNEGNWNRFHHLIGDILKQQLKRTEPDLIKPLYLHICSWYSGKGLVDEAIQYAIKAGNFDLVFALISEHRTPFLDEGKWWVVQRWYSDIPWQIRKANVDILLTELLICEETWNIEEISSILKTLESIGLENLSDENISLYLFHLGYFLTYFKPDPKKAVESLERSKALCHDETYMFGGRRELILATSRHMLGLTELALRTLEAIQEKFEPSSKMHVRSIHGKVLIHLLSGNLELAINDSKKLLFLVQDSDLLYAKGWGSYFQGNVAFQFFNEYEVIHSLIEAKAFQGVFNYRVYFDTLAGLILFRTLEGNENASKMLLKEMKEKIGKLKDSRFQIYYQSAKARVALLNGKGKEKLAWAETNWVKQSAASYMFLIDVPELTKIRIIISHGSILQVEEALHVLSEVESFLDEVNNRYHDIDIELLKAMALLRLGKQKQTQTSLEKAILLAEEKGLKRAVLEAFQVMPALFRQLELSTKSQRILVRLGLNLSTPKSVSKDESDAPELTLRELELVKLIANGHRNKEIADQLHISIGTVKSHLTNIYKKLKVSNRTSMLKKIMDRAISL